MKTIFVSIVGIVALLFAFNNCGQGFLVVQNQLESQQKEASSLFSPIAGCGETTPKHIENKIFSLGASEYTSIAEDLFPDREHNKLKEIVKSLPVVASAYDGNLEISKIGRFILDRKAIVDYFSKELDLASKKISVCSNIDLNCREEILNQYLYKIFRKEISQIKIKELVAETKDLTFINFLSYIFYSPDFHFKSYSSYLSPYELVVKISLSLFGSFPDDELINKKEEVYSDPSALKKQLIRLLSSPKNSRRFSERFLGRWLSINQLLKMDIPGVEGFDKENQLIDAYQIIESLILNNGSLYQMFYQDQGEEIPRSVLTHPSFAMASSRVLNGEVKTNYVSRGVNISSNILCIPMPPLNQATLEDIATSQDEAQGLTALEAIEFHRSKPQCISCHSIIDPIGVSMEQISPLGKLRTHFPDGSQIQKDGQFLGQQYKDIKSFVGVVAASGHLRSCFMQNFRSLVDGELNPHVGACDAEGSYSDGNASVLDSIAQFFTSGNFLKRAKSIGQTKWDYRRSLVEDLYITGLGRKGSGSEIESWLDNYLKNSVNSVVLGILLSNELKNRNLSEEDFVLTTYKILFGRSAQSSEVAKGIATIQEKDRREFLNLILSSEEVFEQKYY